MKFVKKPEPICKLSRLFPKDLKPPRAADRAEVYPKQIRELVAAEPFLFLANLNKYQALTITPMKLLVNGFKLGVGNMGINLRRGHVLMPQKLLYRTQISPRRK